LILKHTLQLENLNYLININQRLKPTVHHFGALKNSPIDSHPIFHFSGLILKTKTAEESEEFYS
jgi:hypothetical protein